MSAIKVGDRVRWTEFGNLRGGTQYFERITGTVEWVDRGSMATPEPVAAVLVSSVFAFAEGYEERGRDLPVQPNTRVAVSTEILKADR